MNNYDDFYDEPSEFEQQINEFKQSLLSSVKKDYKDEMSALRKENKSLQDIKKRMKEIEAEHARSLQQFKQDKENLERKLKRMRLTELLGDDLLTGYVPVSKRIEKPKCDKCDKYRKIHFTSPSGKDFTEDCPTCGTSLYLYEPKEVACYKFQQRADSRCGEYPHTCRYYQFTKDNDGDESFERNRTVYHGEPFEEVNSYYVVFFKQEDCQKYCDWKTKRAQK